MCIVWIEPFFSGHSVHFFSLFDLKKTRKSWFICHRHKDCVFFVCECFIKWLLFFHEYWIDCDPLRLHLDNDHFEETTTQPTNKNYNNNLWSDTHITHTHHITHTRVRRAIGMIFFHAHQLIIMLIKTAFQTENEVFILFKCN